MPFSFWRQDISWSFTELSVEQIGLVLSAQSILPNYYFGVYSTPFSNEQLRKNLIGKTTKYLKYVATFDEKPACVVLFHDFDMAFARGHMSILTIHKESFALSSFHDAFAFFLDKLKSDENLSIVTTTVIDIEYELINALSSLGFDCEAVGKEEIFLDGKFHDIRIMTQYSQNKE